MDMNAILPTAGKGESFDSRGKKIIKTSIVGIAANLLLAAFKAVIGIMTNSIAIILDAVNNTSDAASSVITIVGTRLALKPPDRKHPFGYGRIEYLTAMIISAIVLYAGLSSLIESVKKIISPETAEYGTFSLIAVAAAVVVKIVLGKYVSAQGKKLNSDSLINSGKDALLDAVISLSTLAAAAVYLIFGLSLEAWLGAAISLFIIKSGLEMLLDTISRLLGERADAELVTAVKKTVRSCPGVLGAYDLIINDFGPDTLTGSVHIEVPDSFTASRLDELTREITAKVYAENKVLITAVGIYSVNDSDEFARTARKAVYEKVLSHENLLQAHGFYISREQKYIRFDAVISFKEKDRRALIGKIVSEIEELYPGYNVIAVSDVDFSES